MIAHGMVDCKAITLFVRFPFLGSIIVSSLGALAF